MVFGACRFGGSCESDERVPDDVVCRRRKFVVTVIVGECADVGAADVDADACEGLPVRVAYGSADQVFYFCQCRCVRGHFLEYDYVVYYVEGYAGWGEDLFEESFHGDAFQVYVGRGHVVG